MGDIELFVFRVFEGGHVLNGEIGLEVVLGEEFFGVVDHAWFEVEAGAGVASAGQFDD